MVKLSITAINTSVTVQDPRAVTQSNEEQAVISVEAGDTKEVSMQWQQLERIAEQLTQLAALGFCTFNVDASGGPAFVEQADSIDNPSLDVVPGGIAAAGSTGVNLTGANLLAGQVQASATLDGDTVAGSILLEDLNPGYAGNLKDVQVVDTASGAPTKASLSIDASGGTGTVDIEATIAGTSGNLIDVEIVDTASGGLAVSSAVVSGRTVITADLGGDTPTCTTLAAAIDAISGVDAAAGGTASDTFTTAVALAPLTGGTGGLAVSSTVVDGRTVITVDLGGTTAETCTSVAAAMNTVLAGVVKATVVGTGSTVFSTLQALKAFTGGEGTGLSITIAGVPCTITAINMAGTPLAEVITISTPNLSGTASATNVVKLRLRSDAKEDIVSVVLA